MRLVCNESLLDSLDFADRLIHTKFCWSRQKKSRASEIPTITETVHSGQRQQTEGFLEAQQDHRNSTSRSRLSSSEIVPAHKYDGNSRQQSRERSAERRADPLGLNVLHDPGDGAHVVDIIFVHGLGGTSQTTWSKDRDTNLFWPRQWLPSEPGFERARLLSFGYNAHFGSSERKNILNIADFAKELLYEMKFASDERSQELQIGRSGLKILYPVSPIY